MSNLTYDEQKNTIGNRQINREAQRYFCEKEGDAEKFRQSVDKWRMVNGMEPIYRNENKKSPIDSNRSVEKEKNIT